MTVYEQTAVWQIESPLNQEPYSDHDYYEYESIEETPVFYPNMPTLPLQQRMMIILGVVTVAVIILGLVVVPQALRSVSTFANSDGLTAAVTVPEAVEQIVPPANPTGVISPVFSREVQHWADEIATWAAAHNLDPDMVATIMQIESCGDPQALSRAGAQGLFQVMPYHFQAGEDAFHPDVNAKRGMAYFAERLVQTNGDVGKAFAGYNGGHVAAGSEYSSWAAETQRYFNWSTGIYAEAKAGMDSSPTLDQWMAAGGASLCSQASARLGLQ